MHLKIYGPNSVFIFTTETLSCKNFKKLFANISNARSLFWDLRETHKTHFVGRMQNV